MKISYKPKINGYIFLLRRIQFLLRDKTLSLSTLGAYILFAMQADWDKRHPNYRLIMQDDKQLAKLWRYNESTVYRNRKELIKLSLLEEKEGNTFITNFDLFSSKTVKGVVKDDLAGVHTYFAKPENDIEETLSVIEDMHNDRT